MMCRDARTVVARKVALLMRMRSASFLSFFSQRLSLFQYIPGERPDNHTRNHDIAGPAEYQPRLEHTQRYKAREPEQACQCVEDQYDPLVEEAAVGFGAAAGEDGVEEEVGEGEEGEEGDEDEVGGRVGGGGGGGVVEVPACY